MDAFVRRYGPRVCEQAKSMDDRCRDGVLEPETALEVMRVWLRRQACPQRKGMTLYVPSAVRNNFQ